jgi:hypothetical protein
MPVPVTIIASQQILKIRLLVPLLFVYASNLTSELHIYFILGLRAMVFQNVQDVVTNLRMKIICMSRDNARRVTSGMRTSRCLYALYGKDACSYKVNTCT